jgi:hypothetical protein
MILRTISLRSPLATVVLGDPSYASGHAVGFTLDSAEMNAGPQRLQRDGYPLAPGGMVTQLPVEPREVQLSGRLWATSAAEANALRSQLVQACTGLVTIEFAPGAATLELTGLLDGSVELSDPAGYCMRFRLRLVCPDPVAYETSETTVAVGGAAGPVVNAGDGEVWPDLRFTVVSGTLTALSVSSTRTSRTLALSGLSAAAGTVITVAMLPGYEEVLVGTTPAMHRVTAASRFWSLLPGSNAVTVTATGASVSGTCSFRSGWVS